MTISTRPASSLTVRRITCAASRVVPEARFQHDDRASTGRQRTAPVSGSRAANISPTRTSSHNWGQYTHLPTEK